MGWDPNQAPPGSGANPYGTPQNPYEAPQTPYGQPPTGYGAPPSGYGYPGAVPPSAPLPLGQALQQLPNQYLKILTKPGPQSFAEELGKASWDIVWVQLLIEAVIAAVLGYISSLYSSLLLPGQTASTAAFTQYINLGTHVGSIVVVPIAFFIAAGIYYLLAKAFGGQGTFLQQAYANTLYSVPIGIIVAVLNLIPILGSLAAFAFGIYGIVLNIFSIMAAHRLSGGKATAVVLIPVAVVVLLVCALFFFLVILAASMIRSTQP